MRRKGRRKRRRREEEREEEEEEEGGGGRRRRRREEEGGGGGRRREEEEEGSQNISTLSHSHSTLLPSHNTLSSSPHHGLILGSLQVLCQLVQLIDSSLDLLHVARHLTLTESVYLSLVLFQQSFKLCLPALDRSNVTMLSLSPLPSPAVTCLSLITFSAFSLREARRCWPTSKMGSIRPGQLNVWLFNLMSSSAKKQVTTINY